MVPENIPEESSVVNLLRVILSGSNRKQQKEFKRQAEDADLLPFLANRLTVNPRSEDTDSISHIRNLIDNLP